MQNSGSPKSKGSYVLTATGRTKIENALKEKYSNGSYNISTIANGAKIDRAVVSKILSPKGLKPIKDCKPVRLNSLDELFSFLNIDLEEPDYQEGDPRERPSQPKNQILSNNAEQLKLALKDLNYDKQRGVFRENLRRVKAAGSFLIHGEAHYGQKWLVNQLSYNIPGHDTALKISVSFKKHRRNIQDLWDNLAREVGTERPVPPDIMQRIYDFWKNGTTVILCFHDVDLISNEYLKQLLSELWQPLVKKIAKEQPDNLHLILLFLVYNLECKEKFTIPCMSNFDYNKPENPVEINQLSPFEKDEITRWVGTQTRLFNFESSVNVNTGVNTGVVIQDIIKDIIDRNQTPEKALETICTWCNLDWCNDIERKLAL